MSVQRMPTFGQDPGAALASFHEHGYQIEPDVWTPEECCTVDRGIAKSAELQGRQLHAHDASAQTRPCISLRPAQAGDRRHHGEAAGGKGQRHSDGVFSRPTRHAWFCRAHQDNYYVEALAHAFASAWSPLVDVSPANGGLIVWPGSQREPILPVEGMDSVEAAGQDKNARRQQVAIPAKYQPLDVIAPAGSVVFIHGFLVHASHQNRSSGFRRVLLATYVRTGEKFRPGFNAQRAVVDVYS